MIHEDTMIKHCNAVSGHTLTMRMCRAVLVLYLCSSIGQESAVTVENGGGIDFQMMVVSRV